MFLEPSSVRQAAALPFRAGDDGFELLFVSSKRSGRWLFPKGWPKKNEALHQTAAREAAEEAGVGGVAARDSLGTYDYIKRMRQGYKVRCRVFVFPFLVESVKQKWSEKHQRSRRWCGLADAAEFCDEPGLSHLIAQQHRIEAHALREFLASQTGKPAQKARSNGS